MTDQIRLFAYGTGWGIPFETSAPFPLKLATWLRMAEVPFELVVENDASKGPKGKAPWIEWKGERMGDSGLIIEHVSSRLGIDLDAHLDARERAQALAVQRMIEEHYHQCFEHQLFFGVGAEDRIEEFKAMVGFPVSVILPFIIRRSFKNQLYARGMGRHDPAVIVAQGQADLDAIAVLLGDQPYMLGDEPCSLDAVVFGFLGVTAYVSGNNPLFRHVATHDNLMRYCERMRARYFPETLATLAPLFAADQRKASGSAA